MKSPEGTTEIYPARIANTAIFHVLRAIRRGLYDGGCFFAGLVEQLSPPNFGRSRNRSEIDVTPASRDQSCFNVFRLGLVEGFGLPGLKGKTPGTQA